MTFLNFSFSLFLYVNLLSSNECVYSEKCVVIYDWCTLLLHSFTSFYYLVSSSSTYVLSFMLFRLRARVSSVWCFNNFSKIWYGRWFVTCNNKVTVTSPLYICHTENEIYLTLKYNWSLVSNLKITLTVCSLLLTLSGFEMQVFFIRLYEYLITWRFKYTY